MPTTRLIESGDARFLECAEPISRIDEAIDLVAACAEERCNRVLLDGASLPEAFFDLRSGFAGEFVQKMQNYRVRVAVVLPPDDRHSERFQEFVREARRGTNFRTFDDRTTAESWLSES
jgi:hypothetical protein